MLVNCIKSKIPHIPATTFSLKGNYAIMHKWFVLRFSVKDAVSPKLVYGTALDKWLFCENLSFSHTNTLSGFIPLLAISSVAINHYLRFCDHVELLVRKYQKAGHTRQWVNTGCTGEKDQSAPLLFTYIYLSFATGRLAIRFFHVTSRNQLCVNAAGYVKWQHSGRVCTDEMLWKCNSSLEDQTNMARCIVGSTNGNYRTELDLYSHFLKRWRWSENKIHPQTSINIIQTFYMSYLKKKSHLFCVSKRRKVESRTK